MKTLFTILESRATTNDSFYTKLSYTTGTAPFTQDRICALFTNEEVKGFKQLEITNFVINDDNNLLFDTNVIVTPIK
jgi:hypothetical protein